MSTELGFLGTGAIASAMVRGLCTSASPPESIWLSPRNAELSATLSKCFDVVRVAGSNQEVLDRCDTIVLSVRPQVAVEALQSLAFKPDHHLISIIATFSRAALAPLVAPATHLIRAAPLPPVAVHLGPTIIYPHDERTRAIFDLLGTAVEVEAESEFDALFAATAEMATFFATLGVLTDWLTENGVEHQSARRYITAMFGALADTATRSGGVSFADLAVEHMTKGGLNEQLHREIVVAGTFDSHRRALDGILARLRGIC